MLLTQEQQNLFCQNLDVPINWVDQNLNSWTIKLQWKFINNIPSIVSFSIASNDPNISLSSFILKSIPFRSILKKSLNNSSHTNLPSSNIQGPLRGSSLSDQVLLQVANLYRFALSKGLSPSKYIAQQMSISPSTAAKRIMVARKRNFLFPANVGRSGELLSHPQE